jgi:SAM-dependent MidA family methyltransferase
MSPFALALAERIRSKGPISVETFMAVCNAHYYAGRDPFGVAGDFTTAPEISQMFGELVAAVLAQSWHDQGAPNPVQIVELGPGRGTLMADLRRTLAKVAPALAGYAQIHLIEQSPALRARQEGKLGPDIQWHAALGEVPPRGALLLIANEFLDCLPVRQEVFTAEGFNERFVGVEDGAFRFVDENGHAFASAPPDAEKTVVPRLLHGSLTKAMRAVDALREGGFGTVSESAPARNAFAGEIARRIQRQGGIALIIDYGYLREAPGETLQALKAHEFVSPLAAPGDADLTAHVDFGALIRAAEHEGVQIHGPVTQGTFLKTLGIAARAARLKAGADAETGAAIDTALARLTGEDQMGTLFKVMALTRIGAPEPAGFSAGY